MDVNKSSARLMKDLDLERLIVRNIGQLTLDDCGAAIDLIVSGGDAHDLLEAMEGFLLTNISDIDTSQAISHLYTLT